MEEYTVNGELKNWLEANRLTIIVGHFGTGKTEVSVNMAMALGTLGHRFIFADLDVVDPYFRSRERKTLIEENGGQLITSSQSCMDADIPSIPSDTAAVFDTRDRFAVMDIGGDASGARVLAQFRHKIIREKARVVCVINAARPLTKTAPEAAAYIRSIEDASGVMVTELINNTHICAETTREDIISGGKIAAEVSRLCGIPLACHTVEENLAKEEPVLPGGGFIWPVRIYMKKPWEI